jgi:hypothetical protein
MMVGCLPVRFRHLETVLVDEERGGVEARSYLRVKAGIGRNAVWDELDAVFHRVDSACITPRSPSNNQETGSINRRNKRRNHREGCGVHNAKESGQDAHVPPAPGRMSMEYVILSRNKLMMMKPF